MNDRQACSPVSIIPGMMEPVEVCAFCGSNKAIPAIEGVKDWFFDTVDSAFAFNRCSNCESLILQDRIKSEFLHISYNNYYTHNEGINSPAKSGVKSFVKSHYVAERFGGSKKLIDRFISTIFKALSRNKLSTDDVYRFAPPAPAKILDYGCGSGSYLLQMKRLGYAVTGVDFDPIVVKRLSEMGLSAMTPAKANDKDWDGHFDFITLGHVIEHVPEPVALLKRLRQWLRPGGKLFVECPNAKAASLEVFGRFWRGLEAPRHLAIPTRKGLETALNQAGFEAEFWHIRPWTRQEIIRLSMQVVPPEHQSELANAATRLPFENFENCEFLINVSKKTA